MTYSHNFNLTLDQKLDKIGHAEFIPDYHRELGKNEARAALLNENLSLPEKIKCNEVILRHYYSRYVDAFNYRVDKLMSYAKYVANMLYNGYPFDGVADIEDAFVKKYGKKRGPIKPGRTYH